MHKGWAIGLSVFLCLILFCACGATPSYVDGTYRAEFQNYDSRGYKDFIELSVEGGVVHSFQYNAVNEDGLLKSEDLDYREAMEGELDIYPARFSQDLVNQYLDTQDIDEVDVVAGATYSSESFIALFTALEPQLYSGETETLIIENTSEQ